LDTETETGENRRFRATKRPILKSGCGLGSVPAAARQRFPAAADQNTDRRKQPKTARKRAENDPNSDSGTGVLPRQEKLEFSAAVDSDQIFFF
jgi:hypothetical protein